MSKKFIPCGDIEIEKHKSYYCKNSDKEYLNE